MSFREKSAWISFVSIGLVAGFYFTHIWGGASGPPPGAFQALLHCIVLLIVIEIVAHVVVAIRAPLDAKAPKDERERLIELKAIRLAYYVFMVGSALALLSMHHGVRGADVGYLVLAAFVVAELVNYGARIVFHRRGV